jgi:hypothetical protein
MTWPARAGRPGRPVRTMEALPATNRAGRGNPGARPLAGRPNLHGGHAQPVPDFVIAGAAKCGTTALYTYLSTHPQIAMSMRKEPYFWCPDVPVADAIRDMAAYDAIWPPRPAPCLRGEATPAYLRSAVAAGAILAQSPAAKFVVILRNPVEMLASYHAQLVFSLQEEEPDLARAWDLQATRRQGNAVPASCFFPPDLQYGEVCALGDQLGRMMAAVPPAQLMTVLLDDLRADPRTVYRGLLDFLGLADDGRTDFAAINRNRRRKALPLVRLSRRLAASWPLAGLGLPRLIDRLSLDEAPRPPLDPALALRLHRFFLPQVEKLEALLERDLRGWKAPG